MSGLDFAVWLALIGCIVGGVRGGLLLADTLAVPAADGERTPTLDAIEIRAFAAALLAAHAGAAAVLGYNAAMGQGMALALGLGWIAAAAVRFWSARRLGQRPRGAAVELLTGIALALPAWAAMARLAHGAVI